MSHYLDVKHDTGIAYGDGFAQGDAVCGSVMKLVGDDLFSVADDATEPAFGILLRDVKSGEMPTIYTGGGVYETDNFTGTIQANDRLKVHATNHNLTNGAQAGDVIVAQAISMSGGVLKFKLLV
jgi:hypothetical protein